MNKLAIMTSVAGLASASLVWGQAPPAPGTPVAPLAPPEAKVALPKVTVQDVLNKRIESVNWDETALETILGDWLQEQGAINVVVRWRALEAEGITPDTPVTLRMRNTTVGQILTEALEDISSSGTEIRYRGIGNTLQVSTRTDLNSKLYTRSYSVDDLLFRVPNFTDGPQIELDQQSAGGGGGGAGIGQTTGQIFGDSGDEEEDDEDRDELDRERMEELITLIKQSIEPETWVDEGGKGTIVGFNRTIVVRNTIEVHEKLGGPFRE